MRLQTLRYIAAGISVAGALAGVAWSSKSFPPCEPVHQIAIQTVLSNQVSADFIQILQDEQTVVDKDQQPTNSFEHSMTGLATSEETTNVEMSQYLTLTEAFIHTNLSEAIKERESGALTNAYELLGKALHPLEDATSPSHKPFQAWKYNEGLWEEITHVFHERSYPDHRTDTNELEEQIELNGSIQYAYDIFVGKAKMPAHFFDHTTYTPGDNIYLFGFSRGAYTVRALAGLIHMCGLIEKGSEGLIPYALRLYRTEAPNRSTLCDGFKTTFSRDCSIHFIGVWDTVSSVGWILSPVKLPHTANNSSLNIIRHAISIDERRCFFRQNTFAENHGSQDIKEVWFAGVHSDVGGGYSEAESALAKLPLQWLAREAGAAGALFDEDELKKVLGNGSGPEKFEAPDYRGKQHNSLSGRWWLLEFFPHRQWHKVDGKWKRYWTIPLGRRRVIPPGITIHQSVLSRINDPSCCYKPNNLPQDRRVEQ